MTNARMTKADWRTINSALALLEAETEGDVDTGYDDEPGDSESRRLLDQIKATRSKVHARL